MRLSNPQGLATRSLYVIGYGVVGLPLGWYLWPRVPDMLAGAPSALSLIPLGVLVLAAVFMMVRAVSGGHEDWMIGDRDIRIRSKSLTSWGRVTIITAGQIEAVERMQHELGGDTDNGLPCVSLFLTLKDGRIFESPRIFDDAKIGRAVRRIEALLRQAADTDP